MILGILKIFELVTVGVHFREGVKSKIWLLGEGVRLILHFYLTCSVRQFFYQ